MTTINDNNMSKIGDNIAVVVVNVEDDDDDDSGGGGGRDVNIDVDEMKNNKIIDEANHHDHQFNSFNYWNKNSKQLDAIELLDLDLDDKNNNENEDLNEAFIIDDCNNTTTNATTKTSSENEINGSNDYYYLRKLEQFQSEIDNFLKKEKETLIKNEISNSIETRIW